jgi:hypothetical protein
VNRIGPAGLFTLFIPSLDPQIDMEGLKTLRGRAFVSLKVVIGAIIGILSQASGYPGGHSRIQVRRPRSLEFQACAQEGS